MPRNGSGTFTLVSGNPVVTGTTIESNWANTTLSDIATTLTDSLSRSGQGGMTAALRVADGTQGAPGVGFANETGSGFYRAGTGEVWAVVQGAQTLNLDANGVYVPADKTTTVDGAFVHNEAGADKDARFEGDTDANLLFTDASTDRVGIGTATPAAKLDVNGTAAISGNVTLSGGTANGVLYLDGSKVATSGSALTFDGTNLSLTTANAIYKVPTAGGSLFDAGGNNGIYVQGTPSGLLGFYASGSEQMRLTSTGLGIGTSSPGAKLDVNGNVHARGASFPAFKFADSSGTAEAEIYYGISSNDLNIVSNQSGGVINLQTGGGVKATLDSSGNLGLGVTPSAWATSGTILKALQIGAAGSVAAGTVDASIHTSQNAYFDGTNWKYIQTATAGNYYINGNSHVWRIAPSGTAGNTISFTQAMTLTAAGDLLVGSTTNTSGLKLLASDGTVSTGFLPFGGGSIAYTGTWTNHAFGFTTNGTERARITSGGDLLVPSAGSGSTGRISVRKDTGVPLAVSNEGTTGTLIEFSGNGSGALGSITHNGTNVAYNTSSDYRLKDNPQPLTGSGAFIDALEPKTWDWKTDGSKGVGFIAHEVQAVSPSSVVGEKDAVDEDGKPVMQAMEYGSAEFIANIIAELQSLRARVAALEAKP